MEGKKKERCGVLKVCWKMWDDGGGKILSGPLMNTGSQSEYICGRRPREDRGTNG